MKKELRTPEWIDSLIDNLAPIDVAEEIRGDLYEFFLKDTQVHGERSWILLVRLDEIKAMDRSALTSSEKKELRREVRSIKGT